MDSRMSPHLNKEGDMQYIKLTGAKVKHLYMVEYYDMSGTKVDSGYERLADLDKRCPRHVKLRLGGNVWGRVMESDNILPISQPRFLRLSA